MDVPSSANPELGFPTAATTVGKSIWTHFSRQGKNVTCSICVALVGVVDDNVRDMLRKHLSDVHPVEYALYTGQQLQSGKRPSHDSSTLLSNLALEWVEQTYTDVEVRCGDGVALKSHRVVLAALSPLLREAMLQQQEDGEAVATTILAPDVSSDVLYDFLQRVYTGGMGEVYIETALQCMGFSHMPSKVKSCSKPAVKRESVPEIGPDTLVRSAEDDDLYNLVGLDQHDQEDNMEDESNQELKDDDDEDYLPPGSKLSPAPVKRRKVGLKPREYSRPRSGKRMLVWKYFEKLDQDNAKCHTCQMTVRTEMNSISGLTRHLRHAHPDVDELLARDREEFEKSVGLNAKKDAEAEVANNAEVISECFESVDEGNARKCLKCGAIITTRGRKSGGSGCLKHLKKVHPDVELKAGLASTENSAEKKETTDIEVNGQDSNNPIWEFFTKRMAGEGKSLIACNECDTQFDTSEEDVLLPHLDAHPKSLEAYRRSTSKVQADEERSAATKAEVKAEEDEEKEKPAVTRRTKAYKKRSAIWSFFSRTGNKNANCCKTCDKSVSSRGQNTTNMIRHLQNNHRDIYLQFIEATGSASSETAKAAAERPKKKRGPKATYDDDPIHRTCPECQKPYSCRAAMLYHRKVVHSGIRPFKCEECGKTFARVDSFRGHTHNTERSFLCSVCGKTFARRNIRDVHERAHYGDRRYKCDFCEKRFMTNQQKTNHERVHTGERPFQCTDCGRQFAQQHQLTTHSRIHTGEKPYSCQHCTQMFRHLSSRNNHKCEGKMANAAAVAAAIAAAAANAAAAAATDQQELGMFETIVPAESEESSET